MVFDLASGAFQTSYTPPAAVASPTATTLPLPGQTGPSGSGLPTADWPAPTGPRGSGGGDPNDGGNGTGNGNGNGGGGNPSPEGDSTKSHTTIIALATTFSVLALLVGATAATWYLRRRRSQESFHLLSESADEESPYGDGPVPVAGMAGSREKGLPLVPMARTVKERLSRVVPGLAAAQDQQERRDMLVDEDTREFEDNGWYGVRRNPSSGQVSWASGRRPTLERVYDSLASLRTVGGAMIGYAAGAATAGARSLKSREASTASRATTLDAAIWDEKHSPFDPYRDDFGGTAYAAPSLNASRPRGGRQASSGTYVDPFNNYDVESLKYDPDAVYRDDDNEESRGYLSLRDPPPPPKLQSMRHPATLDLTRLTPMAELSSLPTITDPATSSESSLTVPMPRSPAVVSPGGNSSSSSHDPPQSPRRPSSIIDANPPPQGQYVKRSNSWWTKFARAPLLDRRTSSASRSPKPLEFRDPNPPPRLLPIEESMHSNSPDSPEARRRSSSGHAQQFTHHHGRSASSLQTAKTADSAALERMAHNYQIIQKEGSGSTTGNSSHRSYPSRDTSGDSQDAPATEFGDFAIQKAGPSMEGSPPLSLVLESSSEALGQLVHSPVDMTLEEASTIPMPDLSASPRRTPPSPPQRRSPGSKVSERVQAYERRMSQQIDTPPKRSPPPVPARTRISSTYGLAPKPSLFVANPDHKKNGSGDS